MNTMRPTRLNARLPVVAVLGAVVAAGALLASPGTARAGDDRPIDEQILHSILTGIGLQDPNAAQPTYQERPPLAIPKSDTLPPPQKPGAVIAKNPAWPKDPGVQRAKMLAKQERDAPPAFEQELSERNPLPPNQLGPKYPGRRHASPSTGNNSMGPDLEGRHRMMPSQLGYVGGLFGNMFGSDKGQQTAQFTGEPARTSLTEPPPGYQTPSPDQPYGLSKQTTAPKADNSYLTKGEVVGQ